MEASKNIVIQGIPENVSEDVAALFRSRILNAANKFIDETSLDKLSITVTTASEVRNIRENTSVKAYSIRLLKRRQSRTRYTIIKAKVLVLKLQILTKCKKIL